MSEYKENTVGWWLSQLKEPLRGEMFGRLRRGETTHNCDTLSNALFYATSPSSFDSHYRLSYLLGIVMFYDGDARQELDHRADGWDMAKECAPDNWLKPKDGGEDKAIVDSPKKTRELFFYADETLSNPLCNPFNEPLVIYPRGETNSVIVEEDKIKDLMNANPGVTFWPTNVGATCLMCNGAGSYEDQDGCWDCGTCDGEGEVVADSPAPKDSWQESQDMATYSAIRNHPKLGETEAPERAVVGYEEPKPIDTIEKKHELRIKNLEARVKQLEETISMLTRLYIKE